MRLCYHPSVPLQNIASKTPTRPRRVLLWRALVISWLVPATWAVAADDPLARARLLYNQGQFEAAINAAEQARLVPGRADSADLVAARAYLERFRASAAGDDLVNARERLRRIDPQRFPVNERTEYVVGLGEALFFEGAYGAAANVLDPIVRGQDLLGGDARERVLDWWASALDRDAKPRPEIDRQGVYQHIRSRMEEELAAHPGSGTAAYWLAAAARAQGDLQTAWDAAFAGWVRASLTSDRGAALRADLDRLVLKALVPDRAKATAQTPESLRQQWEQFKERWAR
jgi:tetratricopeptide (TPR) repeat protein